MLISKCFFDFLNFGWRGGGNPDDYYDEDDFYNEGQGQNSNRGKPMTLAEEKEALKRKLKEIGTRKKKPNKYKKEPKDILNDPKINGNENVEEREGRA